MRMSDTASMPREGSITRPPRISNSFRTRAPASLWRLNRRPSNTLMKGHGVRGQSTFVRFEPHHYDEPSCFRHPARVTPVRRGRIHADGRALVGVHPFHSTDAGD